MKPNHNEIGVGATEDVNLRVSVATYNRVTFPHPDNGTLMLALERKATVMRDHVRVQSQPFGGAVRILDPAPLQQLLGAIRFDSDHSRSEGDFRLLISPSLWEPVKQYCVQHLARPDDGELESDPHRELSEEFAETLQVRLQRDQYAARPLGFAVEDNPVPTESMHAHGRLTVRLYSIFEALILDSDLCRIILSTSQEHSDRDLAQLALQDAKNDGRGHANSILTLPLHVVKEAYLALAPEERYKKIVIESHELDESVLAILENIDVPQYQRI